MPWLLQAILELDEVVSSRTNNLRLEEISLVTTFFLSQRSPAGSNSSTTASFDSLNHGLRKTWDVLMESSDSPDQVIWRVEMGLEATLQYQFL